MNADQLLTTTRAVRKRLDFDRTVPREVIEECLELAIQAPTGSNAQGWRFLIVTETASKRVIAEAYRKAWYPYREQGLQNVESLDGSLQAQQRRVIDSAHYLAENMERAPVLVIPCLLGKLPDGAPGWMHASMYASIFPAVWSFQLALRSRGLGSALTTLHLMYAEEVAAELDIPDTVTQACLLPVAYTVGTEFKPARRRPATEVTRWERWS